MLVFFFSEQNVAALHSDNILFNIVSQPGAHSISDKLLS
jgi:hypothetical protein